MADIVVRLSSDKLMVYMSGPPLPEDSEPFYTELDTALEELGLPALPGREELEIRVHDAAIDDVPFLDAVILTGQPPVPSVDGTLEWTRDFFASGFKVDEDKGTVDYRTRQEDLSVEEKELLVRVFSPVEGQPGQDLLGQTIKVGKPKKAGLRTGPNILKQTSDDGVDDYFAAISGRLRWVDGTLSVDPLFVVNGDVGLETGNIKHPGMIEITGDVRAGARVEAEGDILVKGVVEPADIVAGGSLLVNGGILGDEEHGIEVGGGVQAKYLMDARVRAVEDVEIAKEITKSWVRTLGSVRVKNGRIVSSDVMARGDIEVGLAGGDGAVSTVLTSGVDYRMEEDLIRKEQEATQRKGQIKRIQKAVLRAMETGGSLTDRERRAACELLEAGVQIKAALDQLRIQCQHIVERVAGDNYRFQRSFIEVGKRCYPDTELRISNLRKRITRLIEIARRFVIRGNEIVVSGMDD
ncbi:MAG: FapA family protein [bacterium]